MFGPKLSTKFAFNTTYHHTYNLPPKKFLLELYAFEILNEV